MMSFLILLTKRIVSLDKKINLQIYQHSCLFQVKHLKHYKNPLALLMRKLKHIVLCPETMIPIYQPKLLPMYNRWRNNSQDIQLANDVLLYVTMIMFQTYKSLELYLVIFFSFKFYIPVLTIIDYLNTIKYIIFKKRESSQWYL